MGWSKQSSLTALIMLASWFTSAVYSNTVYISTSSNASCLDCITISQFANQFRGHHESNTTAILLSGNHVLKENLVIKNVSYFSLIVEVGTEEVSLLCAEHVSMKFQSTLSIQVSSITLIGCVANQVENVGQFRLEDSIIIFLKNSPELALSIIESSVLIRRTSFLHIHPIGSVQNSSSYAKTYYRYPVEFYGAIISLNSTLVILDSAFEGSKVGSIGGAIYTERNDLVIKRCNFSFYTRSCKHQCYGGALFAINSRVAISVSNFIGNEITYYKPSNRNECHGSSITRGGALGFIDSTVMIDQTNFFDNSACTGGAVHTLRGIVSILNANFMHNRAFSTGSGVSAIAAACVYINNCNLTFNLALRKGTLSILDSIVILNNSNFYRNMAGINGGAIKTTNKATVIVSQSMILDNGANHTGGGIYATYNSTILLERSILKHNFACKAGGGIKAHHDSKLHFWDKVIIKNNAAYYGGAVHMHFSSLISNGMLIITNNSAALGIIAFLYSQGHFKEISYWNITLAPYLSSIATFKVMVTSI